MSTEQATANVQRSDKRPKWLRGLPLFSVSLNVYSISAIIFVALLALGAAYFIPSPITVTVSQALSLPLKILIAISVPAIAAFFFIFIMLLFVEGGSDLDGRLQIFILVITVASFYAYGWPHQIPLKPFADWISELCVIMILFLLSELAVNLTLEARKITASLQDVEQNKITPIRAELDKISEKLSVTDFSNAVGILKDISEFYHAIDGLKDIDSKRALVRRFSEYAGAWAGILQAAHGDKPDQNDLRIECFKLLFDSYLSKIIEDIHADTTEHIQLPANTEFYFAALNIILDVFCKAHTDQQREIFVWAVTNVLPAAFYHWGDEWGALGSSKPTDDFRESRVAFRRRRPTVVYSWYETVRHTRTEVRRLSIGESRFGI